MRDETSPARDIVLVVDDSPETLSVLIEAIETANMTALVARDGLAALTLIDRILPDIVLLDAVMPGIDGFETCRRLKKGNLAVAAVPVIFMTGLSDTIHVVEGLRAGGVDYLTKPINPDELIARIAIHLANARMVEDARRALDATGQSVLALKPDCTVAWASPGASAALEEALGGRPVAALSEEPAVVRWVDSIRGTALSQTTELKLGETGGGVKLKMIGRSATGDLLVRATGLGIERAERVLSRELGLTLREGEVLYWLCEGKTNRDIAQILSLSPRTVMKHVEQIFARIQVENRTAAASVGLRLLVRF